MPSEMNSQSGGLENRFELGSGYGLKDRFKFGNGHRLKDRFKLKDSGGNLQHLFNLKRLSTLLSFLILLGVGSAPALAQVPPAQQAEAQLEQMTPAQVDARIKEMGMTREQAEARAKEMGVDLGKFLRSGGLTPQAVPGQGTPIPPKTPAEGAKPAVEGEAATAPDGTAPKQADVALDEADEPRGPGGLRYFGYDLFRRVPAAFEPSASGPVDPEYLIGAGDFLLVSIWGQVEQRNELEVDKEGRIFIPTVGPVLISGQTLDQARKTITRQMSQSFKGLVESPPTIFLDLTISRLRPKRVYIMGEVRSPGGYTRESSRGSGDAQWQGRRQGGPV